MRADTAIEISGLTIAYGDTIAVDDLSLSILTGERVGLLGPNGAGKTSTIHAICGILTPRRGTIAKREFGQIGIASQEIALYPQLTASDNLRFFGSLGGQHGRDLRLKIDEVLEAVGLTGFANVPAGRFSGGMMRRLNFAAAVLHRPTLLFLDEPTLGADIQSRAMLLDYINSYASTATIVYSTHNMEEVERVCQTGAIMDRGKLIAYGSLQDLIEKYARPVLEVVVDGEVRDEELAGLPAERLTPVSFRLEVKAVGPGLAQIGQLASEKMWTLKEVQVIAGTLESVFLDLTGRRLRDQVEAPVWYKK